MISCVVTVYNEENTILSLLSSLYSQTKKIDEIIVVDAYSKDSTPRLIKEFIKKKMARNILIYRKRGNRSKGRNFGIRKAKGNIILVTDAGCIPHKNWSKFLHNAFRRDVDVVSGFYHSGAKSAFTQSLAAYTCVMEDRLDPKNYLPSSRSIAFRKKAWEKAGGYPEYLDTCEDLVFARELIKKGYKFVFEKRAYVIWPQQENLFMALKQFYGYAKGDGQALYIRQQTPFLFGRYMVGLSLLLLAMYYGSGWLMFFLMTAFFGYLVWAIIKNQRYVNSKKKFIYLPVLQVTSDIAVIMGMVVGLITRKN